MDSSTFGRLFLALVVCGVLLSRLRFNMCLELWKFRFVSTQTRQFPCNTPRLILVTLVLSLMSFVMAIRGSQLLSGAEVLMLSPVAICTPCWCLASAVLNLMSLRRIWYIHVESGACNWSPESVASLVRIVSACSRHHILFTLKVFFVMHRCCARQGAICSPSPSLFLSVGIWKTGRGCGGKCESHVYNLKSVDRRGSDGF